MKKTYRVIGSQVNLITRTPEFYSFGDAVEIEEEEARGLIRGNISILSDADFAACGFTSDELIQFKSPGSWVENTPQGNVFMEKLRNGWRRLAILREAYLKGTPVVVTDEQEE